MTSSPRNIPPCYCLSSFVRLPAEQLPAPGSRLKIEYYALNKDGGTLAKVKHVTFAKILAPEQRTGTEPPSEQVWGILGFEEDSMPAKCDGLATGLLKEPTCIVTVQEMQRLYSNVIVTPIVDKSPMDYDS